jgi:hypothetical protein
VIAVLDFAQQAQMLRAERFDLLRQRGELSGNATKARAERNSNISRISNSSKAKSAVNPLKTRGRPLRNRPEDAGSD